MKVTTGDHYLAFVLMEECRNKIINTWPSSHEVTVCHHVTLRYNIRSEDIESLQALIDSNPKFEIDGLVTSDSIDFFRVLVNGRMIETDQSKTHLTFTRKSDAENKHSNNVIRGEIKQTGIISARRIIDGYFQLIKKYK